MTRPIFSGRTALCAVVLLTCAALLFPACSKSGRSNNTNTGAQVTGTLVPMDGSHVAVRRPHLSLLIARKDQDK